ncbi:unnamed protein product [Penicillium manginii]
MFDKGNLKSPRSNPLTLQEIDDVISTRALEAFLQWMYRSVMRFNIDSPEVNISAAMELVRFADMHEINGLEAVMAEHIKQILLPEEIPFHYDGDERNTYFIKSAHIISALNLPRGHAVRRLLATASVEGFLGNDEYKFAELTQRYPPFGADLLQKKEHTYRCRGSDLLPFVH